jgi:hypothetical protein
MCIETWTWFMNICCLFCMLLCMFEMFVFKNLMKYISIKYTMKLQKCMKGYLGNYEM